MLVLQGKGVSGGIAFGRLVFFEPLPAAQKQPAANIDAEIRRFNEARQTAGEQLDALAQQSTAVIGEENARVFEIHRMMLEESDFCDPVMERIRAGVCAEYAVAEAGKRLAQDFRQMDDPYMRERSADVEDISRRIMALLMGIRRGLDQGPEPVILGADDFSPSETAQLDRNRVCALVSRRGAASSHAAIFARTLGIPAIIGLGPGLSPELAEKPAAMDGDTGALYIDPPPDIFEALQTKSSNRIKETQALEQFRGKPARSKSGRAVKLYANAGSVGGAEAALAGDAEGIGLFRSEFLYLDREDYPDERLQYEKYRKVIELMGGKEVIIRTLDIGADKQAAYFALPLEENPALGMRAIRICLRRPGLFKTQLRAIYRAAVHGKAALMFPMINSLGELRRAKGIAAEARAELAAEGAAFREIPIGIMIATPASALISDLLAPEADFFSIGTNDLIQYTLALDRQNESLQEFRDDRHQAVLRLIRMTVENAHGAGIPVGICGALGADLELTQTFLEIGLDELSVEPAAILKLRQRIAGLSS